MRTALAGLAALGATGAAGAASLDPLPLANLAAVPGSYGAPGAADSCLVINSVPGAAHLSPRRFAALTCAAAGPATPHELKIDRGPASWRLGVQDADAHGLSEVRGTFSLEHSLPLGPLGGWQVHGDVLLGRPTLGSAGSLVDEQTHVFMSRGLPWATTLRLGASVTALGALDPSEALQHSREIAAELSRSFQFGAGAPAHQVTLKLAEQSATDRQIGSDQRALLTSLSYGHKLKAGAVKADIALTRVEASSVAIQTVARAVVSFSRTF